VLVQVDQVVQPEIVQADLADSVQVDQVVQPEIVQADLVVNDQVEIAQADLVDLVQQVLAAALPVLVHQAELRVEHQVADQVDVQTQQAVVATQLVRSENLAVDLRRVVSQSVQSVKSSTT
jgi:hypothetical protein